MYAQHPMVSVSMITYHAEAYIREAIEGVLRQQVDFPIELVIGDDCSTDDTRRICEAYVQKYPGIIRLLPAEANMGIAANTARTMGSCRGKYIAVCDGDDIWTDPLKLKQQVDFLERNPAYGIVYTDVETISETGEPVADVEQDEIREMYTQGDVFIKLLQANFINNSTAVFRRELIADLVIAPDRSYQIPDHIRWLHIATCAKVHFINYKSTNYRKHSSGLSVAVPVEKIEGNKRMLRQYLYRILPKFHRYNHTPLDRAERSVVFRRILSLALRGPGTTAIRWRILRLAPSYYPGLSNMIKISVSKIIQLFTSPKIMAGFGFKELNA